MARAEIEPEHGGRLALGLVVAGLVCAALFLRFRHVDVVRGAVGSRGIPTGAIGAGFAA